MAKLNGRSQKSIVILLLLSLIVGSAATTARKLMSPKASALFAFGDSYADTGNRPKNTSSWKEPYGITWPGHPTGRFSNGHIQTDFIASIMGLPTPTPFVDSPQSAAVQRTLTGINFAVGGSGVTYAFGIPPLLTQISNFELVLETGAYSPSFLSSSVALVSNVGNDYNAFPYSAAELQVVIPQVVEGVVQGLERLYKLGLRNFLVANLPPLSCVPSQTKLLNFTTCNSALDILIQFHNGLIHQAVAQLNMLPNANYIILDERSAFQFVLNNTAQFGITEALIPCCRPVSNEFNCGDVDAQGNLLYTVCDNPSTHMWWDGVHPTQSTWRHVTKLFKRQPGFVVGAPTLVSWLDANSLRPYVPAPSPSPLTGAVGQLETAYKALLSEPDYSEAVGLLQAVDLADILANVSEQKVTVFLPNNEAFSSLPIATIAQIYAQNQVLSVASFHAVKGFFSSAQIPSGQSGSGNLTTISGLPLLLTLSSSGEATVGPDAAQVIRPDLFKYSDQVVIHGIDKLLLPPTL